MSAGVAMLAAPGWALAHEAGTAPPDLATAWTVDPLLLCGLGLAVLLYGAGVLRLWRRGGIGHGIGRARVLAFALGIGACFLALVWPLDALGEWSLAAHMGQHMLLLAVAAPLLVLGLPVAVFAHALPGGARARVPRAVHAASRRAPLRLLGGVAGATALQATVMVFWHLPGPLATALANEAVHVAMHLSFLVAGVLFWSAVLASVRSPQLGFGSGVLALLATMALMGPIGALLVFAPRPLYADYLARAPALGLDPLADQQLAGLLMWVPSALPYLLGAAVLASAWLQHVRGREAGLDARLARGLEP